MRHRFLACVGLVLACASTAGAQTAIMVDAAIGSRTGSGARDENAAPFADLFISVQRRGMRIEPFVGLAATDEAQLSNGDACRLRLGSTECLGKPAFHSFAALVGAGYGADVFGFRAGVGPAVYRSETASAGAVELRMSLDVFAKSPVALTLSARRAWMPNYRGSSYDLQAIQIGVRLRRDFGA